MKKIEVKKKTLKLFHRICNILAPPPDLRVSEWADDYRMLSAESSAEPGKWRTDRAPYQKEILDSVSDPDVETIVIMSSAQVGKTEILNNIIGYHVDYDPSPILLLMPTESLCQSYSKKRLTPMIRDTPTLRDKIKTSKSRDSDNTILEKGFPGGYIAMVGANAPTGLSSRPIRILLADEVDRFPASAGNEGDPLSLAEKRTKNFWNKKKIYVSTPTEKDVSRIAKEYESSTQEEWCVPCPMCGHFQPFEWERIRFSDITMQCKYCKEHMTEYEWKAQLSKGKYVSKIGSADKNKRGFHLNALTSPWESWNNIIEDFKDSKKAGKDKLKTWVNTTLGLPWEDKDGEGINYKDLIKRTQYYNCQVPERVLLLTAGVDVQDDRLEIEVVGWGEDKESWGIEYKKIIGDPELKETWDKLDKYLTGLFFFNDETPIRVSAVCIDTGGHYTQEAYDFIKPREIRNVFGIKGVSGRNQDYIHSCTTSNREKIHLFNIGVDKGKEALYSRLNIKDYGAGYCHFPKEQDRGYDLEYFKSLCSEIRIVRLVNGQPKFQWIKKYKRNEGLDLRNYATAALEILKPNFEQLKALKDKGYVYDISSNISKKTKKERRQLSKGV